MSSSSAAHRKFSCGGRDFEVRVNPDSDPIVGAVFENNKPIGVNFSISVETGSDFTRFGHGNAALVLMDAAERYVRDVLSIN